MANEMFYPVKVYGYVTVPDETCKYQRLDKRIGYFEIGTFEASEAEEIIENNLKKFETSLKKLWNRINGSMHNRGTSNVFGSIHYGDEDLVITRSY